MLPLVSSLCRVDSTRWRWRRFRSRWGRWTRRSVNWRRRWTRWMRIAPRWRRRVGVPQGEIFAPSLSPWLVSRNAEREVRHGEGAGWVSRKEKSSLHHYLYPRKDPISGLNIEHRSMLQDQCATMKVQGRCPARRNPPSIIISTSIVCKRWTRRAPRWRRRVGVLQGAILAPSLSMSIIPTWT